MPKPALQFRPYRHTITVERSLYARMLRAERAEFRAAAAALSPYDLTTGDRWIDVLRVYQRASVADRNALVRTGARTRAIAAVSR